MAEDDTIKLNIPGAKKPVKVPKWAVPVGAGVAALGLYLLLRSRGQTSATSGETTAEPPAEMPTGAAAFAPAPALAMAPQEIPFAGTSPQDTGVLVYSPGAERVNLVPAPEVVLPAVETTSTIQEAAKVGAFGKTLASGRSAAAARIQQLASFRRLGVMPTAQMGSVPAETVAYRKMAKEQLGARPQSGPAVIRTVARRRESEYVLSAIAQERQQLKALRPTVGHGLSPKPMR